MHCQGCARPKAQTWAHAHASPGVCSIDTLIEKPVTVTSWLHLSVAERGDDERRGAECSETECAGTECIQTKCSETEQGLIAGEWSRAT